MSDRMTWLTSDSHLGHRNILRLADRPFSSLAEMNEAMIERWNSVVSPGDSVIHLGDFGFGSVQYLIRIKERLNGKIELIRGNHDGTKKRAERIFGLGMVRDIDTYVPGQVMIHDPKRLVFAPENPPEIVFHGHSHNKSPKMIYRYGILYVNMSVEHWNYTPVEYNQLMKEIREFESTIQETKPAF